MHTLATEHEGQCIQFAYPLQFGQGTSCAGCSPYSFLTDRTQQVSYCGRLSPIQCVLFGVPQGSVLGPLLYVLYTAELELIVVRHGLRLHMYADDCQVYLNTSVEDVPLAVNKFAACVADINAWLSVCRLRLNAAKTQLLWLGSSQYRVQVFLGVTITKSCH